MPKPGVINFMFMLMSLMLSATARGQAVRPIQQEIKAISAYNKANTSEKIYIQTDKQNYNKEDTIWFKAYVFDAASLGASAKSGLMYIEIADETNRVINRNMVSLNAGLGWGNIPLVDNRFPEGTYTLRAYTNWMRNFDEHYIYSRQFTIDGPLDEDWMINSRFELNDKEGISNVKTDLAFSTNDGHKMFAEELRARITAGQRTLYRTTLRTGTDGTLAFDFNLPDKTSTRQLTISLTKKNKKSKDVTFNVPVIINRDEKTDVQFMPEGGSLISGMLNNVAFKAINEEGKGVDIQGGIYNSANQKVADLRSVHLGMGSFALKPEANQTYTARINYNNRQLSFPLPPQKASGLMLSINNTVNKDSIIITISPATDIQQASGVYYLVGQSRNVVCYGAMVNAVKGVKRFSVHRSAFPTGVTRFTLLSQAHNPVAERIVFVDHHDRININIVPSKTTYNNRDSVNLDIIATDKDGVPVQGSFSLAVTDDAQVKLDSASIHNLPAKVLLADDLKGEVENPGWYFTKGDTARKAAALDVLLLTQGWVNYNWAEVFAPKQKQLTYKPEPEFAVKGRVTNAFNKPVVKSSIVLLSLTPAFVVDTLTDEKGEFKFTALYHSDTVTYNLQAKNKRGRMFNVGIEVDEFTPPVFKNSQRRLIPLYVNIDTARLKALRTRQLYNEEEAKITGRQLKEVQIKARKSVKDSKSLVGPGEADFTLNEEDIKAQGKVTLLDILVNNIPGFTTYNGLRVGSLPVVFIIDGMAVHHFALEGDRSFGSDLLKSLEATDVKGVELMNSGENQIKYGQQYLGPGARVFWYAYIEITTYSGNGIFKRKMPGAYIYRPPVFAQNKEFYTPKYTVKKPALLPDTRPVLFWEPNIVTSSDGRASVSFYTADKATTYNINVQGADMDGGVGMFQGKIKVKANAELTVR